MDKLAVRMSELQSEKSVYYVIRQSLSEFSAEVTVHKKKKSSHVK